MIKLEKIEDDNEHVVNIRDKMQTKSKNAFTKRIVKTYWLRKYNEKKFLMAVFKHTYEDSGLSIAGILNYVKSGEFENDIMDELISRENSENKKRKVVWEGEV
jgi:hypothetical protein